MSGLNLLIGTVPPSVLSRADEVIE